MDNKLFSFAGTSRHSNGELKVRFGQDLITRLKVNVKRNNEDIDFHELPVPMNKRDACRYLLEHASLSTEQQYTVKERLADLNRIERNLAIKRGEVKVISKAEDLLKMIMPTPSVNS